MKYVIYFFISGLTIVLAIWLAEKIGGKIGGIISTAPTVVLVAYIIFCSLKGVRNSKIFAFSAIKGLFATAVFMGVLAFLPSSIKLFGRIGIAFGIWLFFAILLAK